MKRLFTVNGVDFATKPEAKIARGPALKEIRTEKLESGRLITLPAEYKYEVNYGPDHWKRGGQLPVAA